MKCGFQGCNAERDVTWLVAVRTKAGHNLFVPLCRQHNRVLFETANLFGDLDIEAQAFVVNPDYMHRQTVMLAAFNEKS